MNKIAVYLEAERHRVKGEPDSALRLYRDALALDPADWKLRECIAEVLAAKGDVRAALKELFQAAHRLIWQAAYSDATRLLQKMLRMDPGNEHDVTKGVQACLDEIADAMNENAEELPVDGDWGSTREFLESLVLKDSSADFRMAQADLGAESPPPPRPSLVLHLAGKSPVAMEGRELCVGRAKDCHLVLLEGVVSRHHGKIVEMDGHYVIENWESRNGTLLNGKPVEKAEVRDGDTIRFGPTGPEARVEIRTQERSQAPR